MLLQHEHKQIKDKLRELMKNNYASQSEFSRAALKEDFVGFAEEEGLVGQFGSRIYRNNETYLVSHLNNLLHGILTATKKLTLSMKCGRLNNFYK